jgi:hypothetical protein
VRLAASLAFAAAILAATATAAPPVALIATPSTVQRGHVVTLHGWAGDCPVGDAVTIYSRAFVRTQQFAGVPAVYAKVRRGGAFSTTARIPAGRVPGRYFVGARCGGGNLGVHRALIVRR